MRRALPLIVLLALLALALIYGQQGSPSQSGEQRPREVVQGRPSVSDGDTLRFPDVTVRLFGIDAPERDQTCRVAGRATRCGEEARAALARLVSGQQVVCRRQDTDRYGRLVGICTVGGTDLNAELVAQGHALAYREYSMAYIRQENAARQARRGLHAGSYVEPWKYRQGETQSAPTALRQTPYPSCAEARAAGRTPVLRGEPGFNPRLDGDGDGEMCE